MPWKPSTRQVLIVPSAGACATTLVGSVLSTYPQSGNATGEPPPGMVGHDSSAPGFVIGGPIVTTV